MKFSAFRFPLFLTAPLLLCAFALNVLAVTSVEFPLSSMFNGAIYTKSFKAQAVNTIVTDGTNAWIGSDQTITPSGGTNPIVGLTPNDYRIVFSDAVTPWRIRVPNNTNQLNALNLTIGPLPTFLLNLNPNLVATNTDNAAGTNVDFSGIFTGTFSGSSAGDGNALTNLAVFWSDILNLDETGVAPSAYVGNTNFGATQGLALIANSNTNRFTVLSPTAVGVYGVNNTSGTGGTISGDYVRVQVNNSGTAGSVQPFVALKGDGGYITLRKSDNATEVFRVDTNSLTATIPITGDTVSASSGVITNGAVAWYFLRTNAAPAITAMPGSLCTTTNGDLYIRSRTNTWNLK